MRVVCYVPAGFLAGEAAGFGEPAGFLAGAFATAAGFFATGLWLGQD